jgi:hypothetical protein
VECVIAGHCQARFYWLCPRRVRELGCFLLQTLVSCCVLVSSVLLLLSNWVESRNIDASDCAPRLRNPPSGAPLRQSGEREQPPRPLRHASLVIDGFSDPAAELWAGEHAW